MNTIKDLYIRVECIDNMKHESCGGYICAIMLMYSLLLNVPPDTEMEKLSELMAKSEDPLVRDLNVLFLELGDIPQPSVYETDKQSNVCLYTECEFYEAIDLLQEVASMLSMLTDDAFSLQFKQFLLDDKDIIYRDLYQIVISKETYEKAKEECPYLDIMEEYEDYCDGFDEEFDDEYEK